MSADGDVAGLDDPVAGKVLTDVVEEATREREPGPAQESQDRDQTACKWADRVNVHKMAERDAERGEGEQGDQDQTGHRQPLVCGKAYTEACAGYVEQQQAGDGHRVRGDDLGSEVVARLQWGDPQLARPAGLALGSDPCSA